MIWFICLHGCWLPGFCLVELNRTYIDRDTLTWLVDKCRVTMFLLCTLTVPVSNIVDACLGNWTVQSPVMSVSVPSRSSKWTVTNTWVYGVAFVTRIFSQYFQRNIILDMVTMSWSQYNSLIRSLAHFNDTHVNLRYLLYMEGEQTCIFCYYSNFR